MNEIATYIGKWALFCAGISGILFSMISLFLVPGVMDLNRLTVAGLFASLAISALLLSGVLFCGPSERATKTFFWSPPVITAGMFLLSFLAITATAPWWARR